MSASFYPMPDTGQGFGHGLSRSKPVETMELRGRDGFHNLNLQLCISIVIKVSEYEGAG
jgi:hypothetical protein